MELRNSPGETTSRTKRKRSPSSRLVKADDRKKVSRACDLCKTKKLRCSGQIPCGRCAAHGLSCSYNAEHRRGRPLTPELASSQMSLGGAGSASDTAVHHPQDGPLAHELQPHSSTVGRSIISHEQRISSRSSQEPDETRFEGHYIGPTSGIAFLHRAQRRFKQDFVSAQALNNAKGKGPAEASVFSYGDGYFPNYSISNVAFPERHHAKCLLDRYFDFAMPTYRFLHRPTVNIWMQYLCDEKKNERAEKSALSNAKVALVYLILATAMLYGEDGGESVQDAGDTQQSGTLFAIAENKLLHETGPLQLESVQARLAQSIYLLASSRLNQAWYTFGTASQMTLVLGLHRKGYSQGFGTPTDLPQVEMRRRTFWSAYTLDKYLSVMLGRPRTLRDEDIDQQLPDRFLNDLDLIATPGKLPLAHKPSVLDAPIHHAKLGRIIANISSDLYPLSKESTSTWMDFAEQRTAELKSWKEALPPFLQSDQVDPSMLIPIFQRQSTVLRLAYAHALILANRRCLLTNFADLNRPHDQTSGKLTGSLKECIDAASLVVDIANEFLAEGKMSKAFWFTHYVSFCAIATLYVFAIYNSSTNYQISSDPAGVVHLEYFEAAEKCQQKIVDTTAPSSPFRRYTILLDELKREVYQRIDQPKLRSSDSRTDLTGSRRVEQVSQPIHKMDSSGGTPNRTPTENSGGFPAMLDMNLEWNVRQNQLLQPQRYGATNTLSQNGLTSNMTPQIFDEDVIDPGLFGVEGELIGWAEFDACAINWPDGLDWDI